MIECDAYCLIISTGPVTEVKTDIYVTSFGPVSDVEMVCTNTHDLISSPLRLCTTLLLMRTVNILFCRMKKVSIANHLVWSALVVNHIVSNCLLVIIIFFNHQYSYHSGIHDGRVLSPDVGGSQAGV